MSVRAGARPKVDLAIFSDRSDNSYWGMKALRFRLPIDCRTASKSCDNYGR